MTPKQFVKECLRTDNTPQTHQTMANRMGCYARLLHGAIGITGEAGEIIDAVKKTAVYGKEINTEHLAEECGDLLWYMAILLDEIGSSFEEVMQANVDKLRKRYPTGFTNKDALERKDKQEVTNG